MLTRSFPLRPIISPWVTYFRRFSRIFPRTICLNRDASRSIFITIFRGGRLLAGRLPVCKCCSRQARCLPDDLFLLHITTREYAGDVVEHVSGAFVVVAEVADEAALYD